MIVAPDKLVVNTPVTNVAVVPAVVFPDKVVNVPVGAETLAPEIEPVTEIAPDNESTIPETVIVVSAPPFV